MNIKEIKEMIDLMNKNNLNEIEVEKDGMRIRLKKSGGAATQIIEEIATQPASSTGQRPMEAPAKAKKTVEIKAPMVGTFFRSPAPDAPPFVDIGQNIEHGQVICIVEAMKLMNEIKSEVKGKVVDILVENATPIEFGQVLFLIEVL